MRVFLLRPDGFGHTPEYSFLSWHWPLLDGGGSPTPLTKTGKGCRKSACHCAKQKQLSKTNRSSGLEYPIEILFFGIDIEN
jgi:hypothetical protein